MGSLSAADLFGKGFTCACLGFCYTCCVRLLAWEWSMLVQTAWGVGRRIALNEDCGSTTWDFVKSYCQERYIDQWILIVKNYVRSVYFSFFSILVFKVVELQRLSRIWSHSCTCVGILRKLQIAALYQMFLTCTKFTVTVPFVPSLLPCLCGPLHCFKYFCSFIFVF